jgi:tetratricopeptide (TPR) repeat protein
LPAGSDASDLDEDVLRELNGLPAGLSERVGAHLAAAGYYLEDEPEVAHQHAVFARSLATRLASVREVVGITGYLTGQYAEALADLRAARRMTGRADVLPIMADCERGLGRPERALAMWDDPQVARLDVATRIELLIVVAGARRDLGQDESAAVMLQVPELHRTVDEAWSARLRYAYADVLAALGRTEEARRWFTAAVQVDEDELTDAAERLAELG